MKIIGLDTVKVRLPLAITVQDHRAQDQSLWGPQVVLKVFTDEGITGEGVTPCNPRECGEHVDDVEYTIRRYLGPAIIGEDPFDLEVIMDKMDSVMEFRQIPEVASFARNCIDMALYDIMGKACKVPVHKLLGGCYRDHILVEGFVYFNKPDIMGKLAAEEVKRGYKEVKLKVGGIPKEDIERVKAVREAVGDDISIKVDANGAWNAYTAVKVIKGMERYEISLVEQPVPRWDVKGLIHIRRHVDTPIMVDESLHSPHDALMLIENDACDIFLLKLAKHGGLYNTKKIVTIAESANIPCSMGNFGGSEYTGYAASHILASMKLAWPYHCWIGGRIYRDDIVKRRIVVEGCSYEVPKAPGIGVELDDKKVKKYSIERG